MKLFIFVLSLTLVGLALADDEKGSIEERIANREDRSDAAPAPPIHVCGKFPNSPYAYGDCQNDMKLKPNDDGFAKLTLTKPMDYFGKKYKDVYINTNGVISFVGNVAKYTPLDFPLSWYTPDKFIAPFWADVDIRHRGNVFYREITDRNSAEMAQARRDVREALSDGFQYALNYNPNMVLIVSWVDVPYFPGTESKTNNFQAIVMSDGRTSMAFFYYHNLQWTTGNASNGRNGLGGTEALVGFHNSYRNDEWYKVRYSLTPDVLKMDDVNNLSITYPEYWKKGIWFAQLFLHGHRAPILRCLREYMCCTRQGNAYIKTNPTCTRFDQWDYINHQTVNKPDQQCAGGTKFNFDETVCSQQHAAQVTNC